MKVHRGCCALLASILLAAQSAAAQSYRVLRVEPSYVNPTVGPIAQLTDLNDYLQGVGTSPPEGFLVGYNPITWSPNGTRDFGRGGATFKINNWGILVFTVPLGTSCRVIAYVNGVEYGLPSLSSNCYLLQLTDSGHLLLADDRLNRYILRRWTELAATKITSVSEDGTGVYTAFDDTTPPGEFRTYRVLPNGTEQAVWSGDVIESKIGPSGHIAITPRKGGLVVISPEGQYEHAPLPAGYGALISRPNAAGDVVGLTAPVSGGLPGPNPIPFLFRHQQLIDLNAASGLPEGSIYRPKQITNTGAIVASMLVPAPPPAGRRESDYVLVPLAPSPWQLRFSIAQGVVYVDWQSAPFATEYIIEAGSASGLADLYNGSVGRVTSIAAQVPAGRYYVRVRARTNAGLSAPSNEVVIDVP